MNRDHMYVGNALPANVRTMKNSTVRPFHLAGKAPLAPEACFARCEPMVVRT